MAEKTEIVETLREQLGIDRVDDSPLARDIAAGDFFRVTQRPACVVKPRNKEEIQAVVRAANEAGYKVYPRGGGMSFSGAYAPRTERSITLDVSALNAVVEINKADMYVIVQPGVTWQALDHALKEQGLRLPAFGTRSGAAATVGGGLSQTGMGLGSGRYGMVSEQVLGLEVVLGDGELVRTGQWSAIGGRPFYRHGGPDLTGPFLGDFGAMGVKVEIALRVIERPEHFGTASFAFNSFEALIEAQARIQQTGVSADIFGLDETLQKLSISGSSLVDDLQSLGKLVRGKGFMQGLRDATKAAFGGKRFLDGLAYSLHVITEARHIEAIAPALAEITAIATKAGGNPIPDTAAKMIRADPFPDMDWVIGPKGETWVPMSFIVSSSQAVEAMKAFREVIESARAQIAEHRMEIGLLTGALAPSLINLGLYFYWADQPTSLHRATASAKKVALADAFAANPDARTFLSALWAELIDAAVPFAGTPLGIAGPELRYRDTHDADHCALLARIKQATDPARTLSPGAFNLE